MSFTLTASSCEPEKKIYLALNKPTRRGYFNRKTKKDRPTVYDCVKDLGRWVFPVGRLDMDTSGLLILTNDTEFGEALLQPDSKVPKTYYVKVAGVVSPDEYFNLAYGLDIGRDEFSGPAIVKEVKSAPKYTWFELTITEGKNRQVRRMGDAIGHTVLKLVRIRIGEFDVGDIPSGKYRKLKSDDLRKLTRK